MPVTIDGSRAAMIDKLGDEFIEALIELETTDLEKLYIRFITERTTSMPVMIRQEVI